MKKIIIFMLTAVMALNMFVFTAVAEDSATVYVSISDEKGALAVAYAQISVTDIDADGVITINDVLYAAHEQKYSGGASAGYETFMGEFGLALKKLWGFDGGTGFGYYVNNSSAMSLTDAVKSGDYVAAYAFVDTVGWSDMYCYFDVNSVELDADYELTLALTGAAFDEQWNPISVAVADAAIIIDGEDSGILTDSEGKAKISLGTAGKYVISATSETKVLVPPVCILTVNEPSAPESTSASTTAVTSASTTSTETTETEAKATVTDSSSHVSTPSTGDNSGTYVTVAIISAVLLVAAFFFLKRRR